MNVVIGCGENSIFWGYNFLSVPLFYVKILQSVTIIFVTKTNNKYLHFSVQRVYFKHIVLLYEILQVIGAFSQYNSVTRMKLKYIRDLLVREQDKERIIECK